MKLRNLMEEIVDHFLEETWAKEDMCKCSVCRLDVMANALNHLPPRYLVTDRGEAFSRAEYLQFQQNIDVITALSQAIKVVKNNPRHK